MPGGHPYPGVILKKVSTPWSGQKGIGHPPHSSAGGNGDAGKSALTNRRHKHQEQESAGHQMAILSFSRKHFSLLIENQK